MNAITNAPRSDPRTDAAPSTVPPRLKHNLVVHLDGTWNTRDDSTNVLNIHNLVRTGEVDSRGERVMQLRYYDEGVGTGVLDNITGGGFGFGLERNVREAYEWLVEHYREGDEIFVFGFSRGAFTARSLVGFISRCGLLRRGAPLTINQLWGGYCILGRQREEHSGFWDRLEEPSPFRQITDLVKDPWEGGDLRVSQLHPTEALLVAWSRRVPVRFLGVFDTVGAVGWDALAIPGVRGRMALHHNMKPTTLICSCYHALAIDENRSSFRHTPFVQYVGHDGDAAAWQCEAQRWNRVIHQRWFVGAHSNIGGGYEDNELAQRPLRWLIEGARAAGLVIEDPHATAAAAPVGPTRDSYALFASPFWTHLLRAKRHFRTLAPPANRKAGRAGSPAGSPARPGSRHRSINETVDASVVAYAAAHPDYAPPNLVEYARRPGTEGLALLAGRECRHEWLGPSFSRALVLALWCSFAALGLAVLRDIFALRGFPSPAWTLAVFAGVFAVVDWSESQLNFELTLNPGSPSKRACFDSVYWVRALGVVLCVMGLAVFAGQALWQGVRTPQVMDALNSLVPRLPLLLGVPFAAAVVVCALNASLVPAPHRRWLREAGPILAAPCAVVGGAGALILTGWLLARILRPAVDLTAAPAAPVDLPPLAAFAGGLLLLQCALVYLVDAFSWAGESTAEARLGSSARLQRCRTPAQVEEVLARWRRMLACCWESPAQRDNEAASHVQRIVGEALWRDIIGLIPLYTITLGLGMWFTSAHLGCTWLARSVAGLPLWLVVVLVTAVADWVEDAIHLHYLARYARAGRPGRLLVGLGLVSTGIKFAGFLLGAVTTAGAVLVATLKLAASTEPAGWRGSVALLFSLLCFAAGAFALVAVARARFSRPAPAKAAG